MPLTETLYKTNTPEQLEHAEFYELLVESKFHHGKWFFVVTERHGWWDDKEKKVVDIRMTLDPTGDEGFATVEEAWKRYEEQVRRRVSDGFVHSFSLEFDSKLMRPVQVYKRL